MCYLLNLILAFFGVFQAYAASSLNNAFLGSIESDPESIVENVSTIHGDYFDYEIDLVIPGPDSLTLSRYYSSRDRLLENSSVGGWRFNPHCFLTIQKEVSAKTYTSAAGKFDYTRILIGTNEGSILTYAGWKNTTNPDTRSLFKVDVGNNCVGLANTARGNINSWTNLKNNELYFNLQSNCYELFLSTGGKRLYVPSSSTQDLYLLQVETLPSGNKIFYEYEGDFLFQIKMTNASEEKILSWIKIQYGSFIHITASDGKSVEYHFDQDLPLLSKIIRSNKPSLKYQYRIVDDHPLLIRKELPEGRFVQIDYYTDEKNKNKVESITTPTGIHGSTSTRFIFTTEEDGSGFTQVDGPLTRKTIYKFDDLLQLRVIEEYLDQKLYRVRKKNWGKRPTASNLSATSVEDGNGSVYYYKSFVYDDSNNITQEKEYGNLTGTNPQALALDEEGIPESGQESHTKRYSYRTVKNFDIVSQKDPKGSSVKQYYKKGTNLLVKKFLLEKKEIRKRWFYNYDKDGSLIQTIIDDGDDEDFGLAYFIHERRITNITPKQKLPNVGAPEIVEEKYLNPKTKKEVLLTKKLFGFDLEGNVKSISVHDSEGKHRYTLKKTYEQGLLSSETDPLGNETRYTYDGNQNLVSIVHCNSNLSLDYRYDLKNHLIYVGKKDSKGNCSKILYNYDAAGNKISETDRFGNQTAFVPDDLGRMVSISYPKVQTDEHASMHPVYTYSYDLFDRISSVTNPNKEMTQKSYTVRGQPTLIRYPDGTQEWFKYDPEGSLHRHLGKDGIIRVFEYDYQGRLAHLEYYQRESKGKTDGYKREYYEYDVFSLISHQDVEQHKTTYTYDGAGRLESMAKAEQKIEFIYDSLGRSQATKKWKSSKNFTLEVKEYDLLDRVIEERTEDTKGNILLKNRFIYNHAGQIQEVIGYPDNQESILSRYHYDDFGRLSEIKTPLGLVTKIDYDDHYIDEWGHKASKRMTTDPLGTQTEEIFNALGRLTKTTTKDENGKLLVESMFFFDLIGSRSLEKNSVISNGKFLRTYKMQELYQGEKLKSTTLAFQTAEAKTIAWDYDVYGSLLAITKPGMKKPITYQYDLEGNIKSIFYKGEKDSQGTVHTISYDKKGNIKEVELDKFHAVSYSFDPNNLLKSEKIKDPFGSYEVKFTYDGEGCIEVIQLPDGSFIKYTYEGPFVKSVSRQSKGNRKQYGYLITSRDQMGHILEEVLVGNAGARKQTWDKAGKKTGISTDFFSDQIPEDGYDLLQRIKTRIIALDGEKYSFEYDYNALNELVFEKGQKECTYSFDSLGNRLRRNSFSYKTNDLNQIVEAEGENFTFDSLGNLETKTAGEKRWNFQTNPLGHLHSVQDTNQTTVFFAYDLNGKRLSKKVETKGKNPKIARYFYLGQTELGCLDEKGNIIELKVPSNPNDPESFPCIAIEMKKEVFVPLYDMQGNIACLIDADLREVVESYCYTAFGEEEIFNERGMKISDSAVGNSWRYKAKRTDAETGLVYFGKRYYDPKIGRWITPDPVGNIDGPNLYRFCRNNPLKFVDYFGLDSETNSNEFKDYFYGEYEPYCHCEQHRDCKRGGDVRNAIGGASLGISSFFMGILNQFAEVSFLATANDFGFDRGLKTEIYGAMEHSLGQLHNMWNEGLVSAINFDPENKDAYFYERSAYAGLIVLDVLRGNVKDLKKGLLFIKDNQKYFNVGGYLSNFWHKGTFANVEDSLIYHLKKHGKGRSAIQYTSDATAFFEKNKNLGTKVILKDGSPGIKIQTKTNDSNGRIITVGGYWTLDGKLVTYWD